jgi:hypothetical protein
MAKRHVVWSLAGVLVIALAAVGVLTLSSGGHRTHDVAGRAVVSPSATPDPSATPTPTPRHTGGGRRRHAAASGGSAASRHSATRSSGGHAGGVPPADPCAHNHHCSVPPAR